ncbi:MAG: TlpA family protein disulfide reductase [Acidobacteria bacterium]|nr:TlpA family protein disulfide reductase [Acidobacteriota bacterium]MBA4183816.1 TlpA family protein disulfide reductase [Acidobacteriota bacterium]
MKKSIHILLALIVFSVFAQAQSSAVRLEGQVVCCKDCWAEKDRTKIEYGNAEDLLRSKSCVEGGDPTLLAVRTGDRFKLYELAEGKFRLAEKNWLSYVGKKIAVSGTLNKKIIKVDTLEILEKSLAEKESAQVLGTQTELKLKDLYGAEQSLANYKGRIVILNFWATYCVPCRQEMPDLSAIQNEFAALGLQVIGASTDEAEDRPKVLKFIKEVKINFPVWLGATSADTLRYGVGTALPATVIIDKNGKVFKTISGVVNQTDLRKDVEKLLQDAEKQAKAETKKQSKISDTQVSSVPS